MAHTGGFQPRINAPGGMLRLAGTERSSSRPGATAIADKGGSAGLFTGLDQAATKARARIEAENRHAASLTRGISREDAYAVFAQRVAGAIEGGRAGILRPDRRRALVALSGDLGMREFDAHLVIAVVQDAARRGVGLEDAVLPGRTAGRDAARASAMHEERESVRAKVGLVAACAIKPARESVLPYALLAVVLGMFLLASLVVLVGP